MIFFRTVLLKLMAAGALLSLSVASAHIIQLDVTLTTQGSAVLARIFSPDGLSVSGVKLNYRLGSAAPVAFLETVAGEYTAPLTHGRATVKLTLLDVTFKGEESQVTGQATWPPTPTQVLRISARPLTSQSFTLSPALIVPTVLIVWLVWRALQRSQNTGTATRTKPNGEGPAHDRRSFLRTALRSWKAVVQQVA